QMSMDSAGQVANRSCHVPSPNISQLANMTAWAPGAKTVSSVEISSLTTWSPVWPVSRYVWVVVACDGAITKGGLVTTRSKVCPTTGSNMLPATTLTRSVRWAGSTSSAAALSKILNTAKSNARCEISVMVTCWTWVSKYRAWMPQLVPMSRAVSTL